MKKIYSLFALFALAITTNAQIVINEVYGAGGNTGAVWKNDFIELTNNGAIQVTVSGLYIHYASATGTFNGGTSSHSLPTVTLNPGQKFLIQENGGTNGTALPTPDATGTLNMAASAGKVALTNSSTPPTGIADTSIIDFVGFGTTASLYEGAGPTPAPSATLSVSRTNGVDTNNNSADFTTGTPTPENSLGQTTLSVSDINSVKSNFVKNTFVQNEISFGAKSDVKIYSMNGQVVRTASVSENNSMNVSDLAPGMYIVTGTVNGEAVSQKILKK